MWSHVGEWEALGDGMNLMCYGEDVGDSWLYIKRTTSLFTASTDIENLPLRHL